MATLGTCLLVIMALAVSSLPVAEQDPMKWYDLEGAELQMISKQLKTLKPLENLDSNGLLSISFGRSPSTFITNDDGTFLFNVYQRVSPDDVSHVLLAPATGNAHAPPPPFQFPPSARFDAREVPEPSTEKGEAPKVFPENAKFYKGSPVYTLEALGKVHLRVTDVKKLMAHRDLA